jgi:hypothetical protein
MTYPLGKLFIDDLLRRDKIDRVKSCLDKVIEIKSFKQIGQMSGNVPFNNIATSHNSIIFRQTSPENLGDLTLTFEFFVNGNAKIFIPFEYVNPHGDKNSENLQFLREQLGEQAYLFWIIDGFKLLLLFLFLLDKYRELLEAEGWTDKLIIKYRVENCWRHILSFDSEAFVNHVKKYGIPICQREQIQIPGYTYRAWFTDSFERISEHVLSDFVQVAESLGLHLESFLEAVLEGLPAYSNKLPR